MAVYETNQVVQRYNNVTNTKPINPQDGDTWFNGAIKQWYNANTGEWVETDLTGPKGETTYFYAAWADSEDGKDGFTTNSSQSTNKGYLGTYSSTSPIQSNKATDYAWVKLAGAFDKMLEEIQANISAVPKVVIHPTAPKPEPNMQWWQTSLTDESDIIGYFKWDGGEWIEQSIQQSLLNIVELNAVEINGSVISGSSFLNYWDNVTTNGRKGITRIENGQLRINYTIDTGAVGSVNFSDMGLTTNLRDSAGKIIAGYSLNETALNMTGENPYAGGKQQSAQYGRYGIIMTDATEPYGAVNLSYKDLLVIEPTLLKAASGFSAYATSGTNRPTAKRNGKSITLAGAFKNNDLITNLDSNEVLMGHVPVWARPAANFTVLAHGTGFARYMLAIKPNGDITAQRYGITGYTDVVAGSWLTLSCVYSAAN